MPSKDQKLAHAMPLELMRSAPVPHAVAPGPMAPEFIAYRDALKFNVELAAARALGQIPEGYRVFEVRVIARKVNKGHRS